MKNRMIAGVIASMGVVFLIVALHHLASPAAPVYKGKPVSEWVDACVRKPGNSFSGTNEQEFLPVLDIGSGAVPYLVRVIQKEPGFVASKLYGDLYRKLPVWLSSRLPLSVDKKTVRFRAYSSLAALGSAAKPAVPFLAGQFNASNRELDFVRAALVAIGPDAREAIPALTNAFHSTNQTFRWMAARTLAKVSPDYHELVPTMLTELKSSNVVARRGACLVLGGLGPVAKSSLPALTEALEDEDKGVRDNADRALRAIELSTNRPPTHLF